LIGSVSPSRLTAGSQIAYLDDVQTITRNSAYRMVDGFSRTAAELLAREYNLGKSLEVLMMRSGTDALTRALQVLGVGAGCRVAMPDLCFHAVASAVLSLGAIPVFVDVNLDDFNLDAAALDKTLLLHPVDAIVAVDNYGTPANWKRLGEIARRHKTPIIIDACESLGATRGDQSVAEHADVTIVSFSFTKPIHAAGMGGALIANRSMTREVETREALMFRQLRMPEINAAYLVRAWDQLHVNIDHLRSVYFEYCEMSRPAGYVAQREYGTSTRIHAPLLVPVHLPADHRDSQIAALKRHGVVAGTKFACQSALLGYEVPGKEGNFDEGLCKNSRYIASRVITLPTGGGITGEQVSQVKDAWRKSVREIEKTVITPVTGRRPE